MVTGQSGAVGAVAPYHVVLELRLVFESVLTVFLVLAVARVTMRTPLVAIHRHAPPGQTGNHGQCAQPHVVVGSSDVRGTAETERHVRAKHPRNVTVRLMHVLDGQTGLLGQTVAAAAEVVRNVSPDSA